MLFSEHSIVFFILPPVLQILSDICMPAIIKAEK